jgi:hypothetical protein
MTIKGYVVRGQDRQLKGAQVWATADGVSMRRERAKLYGDVDAAVGAWAELRRCSWCAGARILAVHADGTETPQPTYEEALAEIAEIETAKALAAGELAELERLRALLAKVFGGEAAEASLGQLVELAAAELAEIDDAVREAGVEARGPDDTLPARVGRLIEDANMVARGADEADDVLERIVNAWRADEIGAIDGALIEEAEALLGLAPEVDTLAAEPAS